MCSPYVRGSLVTGILFAECNFVFSIRAGKFGTMAKSENKRNSCSPNVRGSLDKTEFTADLYCLFSIRAGEVWSQE